MTGSILADIWFVFLAVSPLVALVFLFLWLKRKAELKAALEEFKKREADLTGKLEVAESERRQLEQRFSERLDIEAEARNARVERDRIETEISDLQSLYEERRRAYDRLLEQVAAFEEQSVPTQIEEDDAPPKEN